MKILFISANPRSTERLSIDEEFRAIMEKIRRSSGQMPMLEIVTAWAARPDDLLQSLNEHQPEIVHFSGHGSLEGISLVGENGKSKLVSTKALVSLFKSFSNCTKLVVLNSCYSKSQAKAINKVIDYVVGMKNPISDLAAITFSASFYRALSFQKTFVEAFEQARTALLLESICEEWTPTLLVRQGMSEPTNMVSLNSTTYILDLVFAQTEGISALPQKSLCRIKRGVLMAYCNLIIKQGAEANENPEWIIPNNTDSLPM